MNDWLRVTTIGGGDYECRMTILKNGRYDHYHYSSLASPLDGRLGLEDHHSPMVVRRAGNIRAIRRIG